MGLDNMIRVRRTEQTEHIWWLRRFKEPFTDDFEVCHWCKCYHIRNGIIDILCCDRLGGEHAVSATQLQAIVKLLKSFNEKNWYANGGSYIWTFQEMQKRLRKDIRNLKILIRLMRKYDLEMYFVDSY